MDDRTRNIVIKKLGTLMLANSELAAENIQLGSQLQAQAVEITRLQAQIAEFVKAPEPPKARPEGAGENLPNNPYNGAGDAKPH